MASDAAKQAGWDAFVLAMYGPGAGPLFPRGERASVIAAIEAAVTKETERKEPEMEIVKRLESATARFGGESNDEAAKRRNAAIADAIATIKEFQDALSDVLDGTQAHHLAENAGITVERAMEIRTMAGLDPRG